jgi:hypothetical protein
LNWSQIHRRIFAATINLNFKFKPITLIKVSHASAFNRRDMDKCIRLSVITLNKAKAFHRVEEFDRSSRLFTRQLTLWATAITAATKTTASAAIRTITALTWRAATGYGHWFAFNLKIGCRNLATTINQRETKWLTVGKTRKTCLLNRRDMHKNIFAAIIANNKAKTFLRIKEFNDTSAFTNNLCWHCWATRGTAAAKTAATACTATTETVTAAESAATAAILIVTETIPLISAAPAAITATPFIETHAKINFPQNSPACYYNFACRTNNTKLWHRIAIGHRLGLYHKWQYCERF